ncbi:MAG: cation-translocating P-type ATPase [Clostridia bacterium]|nr:cation-translocating P-type ATPase [Clostridia bacterium]
MQEKAFETLSVAETCAELQTDAVRGLSEAEAATRLQTYGKNKLEEKKKLTPLQIFFAQLKDPMIYVLFAAIAVTAGISIYETVHWIKAGNAFDFLAVGDWPDVVIILAVILLNAVIGTVQEIKAQSSLDALKQLSSPESTVIRDGKRMRVKSETLVPGDLVVLEEGDTIGADLRLTESYNMKVNESSLTGESTQVEKDASLTFSEPVGIGDRKNIVYMSTPVTYGRGTGIVCRHGMKTEIGRIATALDNEEEEQTPLQKVLAGLSKTLGLLALLVVVFVLIADIVWLFVDGKGTVLEGYVEAVLSAIALAVAAIPEGLPAVVTIVLAVGVRKMVSANTIVRKLPSVETLGAVSVVCSDKTGTLTQNRMTVVEAYSNRKVIVQADFAAQTDEDFRLLARGMSLCSNATVDEGVSGDPTEIALVRFANELGMHKADLEAETPRVDELPFDSERKMMTTVHQTAEGKRGYTKGAFDSFLKRATQILDNGTVRPMTEEDRACIAKANSDFSARALRVLTLAYRMSDTPVEEDLIFVGLVAMVDPERPEAKGAVEKFVRAGITTVMITGDHKDTAFAIAKNLGICTQKEQCRTGAEVDEMSEEELRECCKTVRVFARVSPENKVQIVKAFKANGNICAMTGDGVNDAPSLKAADIGIAMGITGTDVAKGAADMVLTDDNFASIEKAVEEGRSIYANIKKTVCFLLSSNIAEVFAMFALICVGLPAPLIAIHLLWVNLITDSLPAIALGMDPKSPDILDEKPRDPNESIFHGGGLRNVILYGSVLTVSVLCSYVIAALMGGAGSFAEIKSVLASNPAVLAQARTMAFCTLAFGELFHMLGVSTGKHSFVQVFKNKNRMMGIAFATGLILQLLVVELPVVSDIFSTSALSVTQWLVTGAFALLPLIVHEIEVLIHKLIKK